MTAAIPAQRRHPACDWPEEQQSRWVQRNFCPCGTEIPWAAQHCDDVECCRAHIAAERLLDLNGDDL